MYQSDDAPIKGSIRNLISKFENQTSQKEEPLPRQRAKSMGNLLSKVIYKPNVNIQSLDDIEKELIRLETHLNYYHAYEKQKHVSFQDQLFNIFTNIINITDGNDSVKKQELIGYTQLLFSNLNNKLPSNSGAIGSSGKNNANPKFSEVNEEIVQTKAPVTVQKQFSYVPYGNFMEEKRKNEEAAGLSKTINVTTIKENFEVMSGKRSVSQVDTAKIPTIVVEEEEKAPPPANNKTNGLERPVSVNKLRSLFESKSKENAQGLEIIVKDENPQPFIRSKSVSSLASSGEGNFHNYNGLLKSADINRSKSYDELDSRNDNLVATKTSDGSEEKLNFRDEDSDDASEENSDDTVQGTIQLNGNKEEDDVSIPEDDQVFEKICSDNNIYEELDDYYEEALEDQSRELSF